MASIKMIGIIGAVLMLIALTGVVSAAPFIGYGFSGSSLDTNQVSLISSLGTYSTGTFARPSDLMYSISVKGIGPKPAYGDMTAFLNYNSYSPNSRLSYSETTSASGLIYGFSKSISVFL
jgi:hypothetical protein